MKHKEPLTRDNIELFSRGGSFFRCRYCDELIFPLALTDRTEVPPMMRKELHPCYMQDPGCFEEIDVDAYLRHFIYVDQP